MFVWQFLLEILILLCLAIQRGLFHWRPVKIRVHPFTSITSRVYSDLFALTGDEESRESPDLRVCVALRAAGLAAVCSLVYLERKT